MMIDAYRSFRLAQLLLAASLAALAGAFTAEYGFGLKPCVLCLTERVPYAIVVVLAAAALIGPLADEPWRPRLLRLAGLALLINAGIAIYHVGVEQHWWASAVCSAGHDGGAVSVADLAAQMSKPVEVACDRPAWAFHGITFAAMNVVYAGLLAAVTLIAARRAP